jgi:hypothetical protein
MLPVMALARLTEAQAEKDTGMSADEWMRLYCFKTQRKVSGLGIYGVISCCSVVLVDHAAEYLPALDWRVRGRDFRHVEVGRSLLAGLVRAVPVVVARVLAEDRSKVRSS